MRRLAHVVLWTLVLASFGQTESASVAAARAVLVRTFGERAKSVRLMELPSGGNPTYEFEAKRGVLTVRGNAPTAMCRGVYDYLKQKHLGFVAWGGTRIAWPKRLPDARRTRVVSPFRYLQNYNVVTFGYTTAFWDWPQWQRELDWMAVHGFNMALAMHGAEAIWDRVWKQMGFDQAEIDSDRKSVV